MIATAVVVLGVVANNALWDPLNRVLVDTPLAFLLGRSQGLSVVGLLPGALLVAGAGRLLFGMTLREQWGGSFALTGRVLPTGAAAGVLFGLIGIVLGGVAGVVEGLRAPDWGRVGWNVPADLWEEVMVRGLLLHVVARTLGRRVALVWVLVVFGPVLHGLTTAALAPTLFGALFTVAVLRTGNLWAGYVAHLIGDALGTTVS